MLVLGRKIGEKIVIGNDITVTVVEIKGGRVKLGFEGPKDIPINRAEVHQRMEHELPVSVRDLPLTVEMELV